jgi:AGCS family alanine or glycine:cation symporter
MFFESLISIGNTILWSYLLIGLLIILGIYFTVRTKFVQFRYIREMFRLLTDKATGSTLSSNQISSFQAFCISTASRVGTGNLAGVAIAISIGGPGAIFWMWVIALLGAASSFIESTLAQIYKVKDKNGFRGGPAYYMEKGLQKRWMGIVFAVLITLCFGLIFNSVQANTISIAFESAFGINRLTVGIIITVATALIIFGGVQRIAKASQIIVPVMAGLYLIVAFYIMAINISEIPAIVSMIFSSAFGLNEAIGGGIGAAIMNGVKRGLFSNEAGMGSAPNAAATAHVTHPVKQGFIQTLGVFTDTILICSATAFMILLSGSFTDGSLTGIQLTQTAMSSHIGTWANSFVAITILFFAFSSIIGNYYYGETNIEFIQSNKLWLFLYRIAVVGMVVFGSVASIQIVWDLADLFMGLMAVINLIAIFLLGKVAIAALKDYVEQRKQGKDPVFYASSIKGLSNTDCWEDEDRILKKEA